MVNPKILHHHLDSQLLIQEDQNTGKRILTDTYPVEILLNFFELGPFSRIIWDLFS